MKPSGVKIASFEKELADELRNLQGYFHSDKVKQIGITVRSRSRWKNDRFVQKLAFSKLFVSQFLSRNGFLKDSGGLFFNPDTSN